MHIFNRKIKNKYIEIVLLVSFVSFMYYSYLDHRMLSKSGRDIGDILRSKIVLEIPKLKPYMFNAKNYVAITIPFPTILKEDNTQMSVEEWKKLMKSDDEIKKQETKLLDFGYKIALYNYKTLLEHAKDVVANATTVSQPKKEYVKLDGWGYQILSNNINYKQFLDDNIAHVNNFLNSTTSKTEFLKKMNPLRITIFIIIVPEKSIVL